MTVEAIPCAACKWWSNEPVIGEDGPNMGVQGHWMHDGCRFLVQEGGTEENLYTSDQIQDMVRRAFDNSSKTQYIDIKI